MRDYTINLPRLDNTILINAFLSSARKRVVYYHVFAVARRLLPQVLSNGQSYLHYN